MSLPAHSTLASSPSARQQVAFNVKLSDDLVWKIASASPKLVVKDGKSYLKLAHTDGSESILDANFQEETSSISLYAASNPAAVTATALTSSIHNYSLVGKVTSRLSFFGSGLRRSKFGAESKLAHASIPSLARTSESPPNTAPNTAAAAPPRRSNKLVAISGLSSKKSPETRILHLLALGPISISKIQKRCHIDSFSLVENFLKTYGEVLTSDSLAYRQDKYFTYDNFPDNQGPGYCLPDSLETVHKQESTGQEARFYIIKDSAYQHLKIWEWKYSPAERSSILKNMANAFDRLKLAADDPVRNLLISPNVLSKQQREKEKQKEELKRKEYEEEQQRQEMARLQTARELAERERIRKQKEEERKLSNAHPQAPRDSGSLKRSIGSPSVASSTHSTHLLPKITKSVHSSPGAPNIDDHKKTLSRAGSQNKLTSKDAHKDPHPHKASHKESITKNHDGNTLSATELIELGAGVIRPNIDLTPTAKTAPQSPHTMPLRAPVKKATSSSPRLFPSTSAGVSKPPARSRKHRILSSEMVSSSDDNDDDVDEQMEDVDRVAPLVSKDSAAASASATATAVNNNSSSSSIIASAEDANSSIKKPRTISNSSSGSMSSSSNSSVSSRFSMGKGDGNTSGAGGNATNATARTSPSYYTSSSNASSPELDSSNRHNPNAKPKQMISNITSKALITPSSTGGKKLPGSSATAISAASASRAAAAGVSSSKPQVPPPQLAELAIKFRETYAEYQHLYTQLTKRRQKKSNGDRSRVFKREDSTEDVLRLIRLHNELSMWKTRLWSVENRKKEGIASKSRDSSVGPSSKRESSVGVSSKKESSASVSSKRESSVGLSSRRGLSASPSSTTSKSQPRKGHSRTPNTGVPPSSTISSSSLLSSSVKREIKNEGGERRIKKKAVGGSTGGAATLPNKNVLSLPSKPAVSSSKVVKRSGTPNGAPNRAKPTGMRTSKLFK